MQVMQRPLALLCRHHARGIAKSTLLLPSLLIRNTSALHRHQQQQQQHRNQSTSISQLRSWLSGENVTGTTPVTYWDRLLDRVFKRKPETLKDTQHVVFSELKTLVDSKQKTYILIDVREPEEFAEGHIPTAINIPCADVSNKLRLAEYKFLVENGNVALPDATTFVTTAPSRTTTGTTSTADEDDEGVEEKVPYGPPIYFYCLNGSRARASWGAAKNLGYERVKWYKGGFKEWCRFSTP